MGWETVAFSDYAQIQDSRPEDVIVGYVGTVQAVSVQELRQRPAFPFPLHEFRRRRERRITRRVQRRFHRILHYANDEAQTMLIMALVVSPLVIFLCLRVNPYPLVFRCLRESGIPAFFTRSSAANIPVNMELCEKMGLDRNFYSNRHVFKPFPSPGG